MIGAVPRRVSSPIFVGRVAERAALTEALERAVAGQPGIVLITGEAGVGKTRLLTEASKLADALGATTVSGVCVDAAAGTLSYAPFVDIVRDLHRAGLTTSLPTATRAELGRLVPVVSPRPDPGPIAEEGGQGRLFAAIRDALSVASSTRPILVTIEDLHWADRSTRAFLVYLASSLCRERVLVVTTYRPDELHRRHPLRPLLAELERDVRHRRVELTPLTRDELAQQLTDILGAAPADDLIARLYAR